MKNFKLGLFLMTFCTLCSCSEDEEVMTGTIIGRITNSGGENLTSVTMTLSPGGRSRTTGDDGRFEMVDLEPGQYTLQAQKSGYKTNTKTVNVVAGQTASGDMVLTPVTTTAEVEVYPQSLNFGTSQSQLAVILTNTGNAPASWSLDLGENHWLSANPMSGRIGAGNTQSIVFSVNRDKVANSKDAYVTLSVDGNSIPLRISCSSNNGQKAEMSITPKTLDFGGSLTTQDLKIINTGDDNLNWQIKGITTNVISVSATSGTIWPGGSKIVKVTLDREKMTSNINTSFIISDGVKEESVSVTATKRSLNDDENQGGTDEDDENNTFSGTVSSIRPGLAVNLTGVSMANNILTVNFTIQNNEDFDINELAPRHGWSGGGNFIAYDNLGNTYEASDVQELKIGSKTSSGYLFDVRMPIPQGVKMSCQLKIRNVKAGVKEFTNISLPCLYYNQGGNITYDQKKIIFKNLKW